MQAGPTEVTGSGLKIDKNSAANLPGLYACGDACDGNRCVHGAVTGGYAAGKSAAAFARTAAVPDVAEDELAGIKKRLFAPLGRAAGIDHAQFENIIRKIMTENVGVERNETSLLTALAKLDRLKDYAGSLRARDLHELMRVNEALNLLTVAEITTQAALFRKESRNKPYHHRLDYPETDDENWCGQVLVRKGSGDRFEVAFQPLALRIPGQEGGAGNAAGN